MMKDLFSSYCKRRIAHLNMIVGNLPGIQQTPLVPDKYLLKSRIIHDNYDWTGMTNSQVFASKILILAANNINIELDDRIWFL